MDPAVSLRKLDYVVALSLDADTPRSTDVYVEVAPGSLGKFTYERMSWGLDLGTTNGDFVF